MVTENDAGETEIKKNELIGGGNKSASHRRTESTCIQDQLTQMGKGFNNEKTRMIAMIKV